MFSPSEYLTNLNQTSLLSNLVTPQGQLPSIPSIPKMVSAPAGVPVVATVPSTTECNDFIRSIASSSLTINVAVTLAAALVLTYLIKKHGPNILAWFRDKMQKFLAAIRSKIFNQRVTALLPASHALVMS